MTEKVKSNLTEAHTIMTVIGIPLIAVLVSVTSWFMIRYVNQQDKIIQDMRQQVQEHETRINIHDYILTQNYRK
jgi:hypothetical protein